MDSCHMPTSLSTLCTSGLFIRNFIAMCNSLCSLPELNVACTLAETFFPKIKIEMYFLCGCI